MLLGLHHTPWKVMLKRSLDREHHLAAVACLLRLSVKRPVERLSDGEMALTSEEEIGGNGDAIEVAIGALGEF